MSAHVLVTGGTGTLGKLVLPQFLGSGCSLRVLSRHSHHPSHGIDYVIGDLATGAGIDAAVEGVSTVVHLAGSARGDDVKARNLVRALSTAKPGVRQVVFISVVGADRVPVQSRIDRGMFGYFAAKLAAERIVADSGLPFTTLRATQFFDAMLTAAQQLAKLPVLPVPGVRFQPIDAGEVADRLVEPARQPPAGLVPEMAGPRVYEMRELVRSYLRARRKHRLIMPMRPPGKAAAAIRAGANLAPERAVGQRTWEDFLATRFGPHPAS